MKVNPQDELIGYWEIDLASENTSEGRAAIYLRFTKDGLLQWGYENQWRICVLSFDYWIDDKNIITVCPPNPRKEFTPYSFTNDKKLKVRYSNYETIWKKTDKQDFFESNKIWDSGTLGFRQLDYMSELESEPTEFDIKRANLFEVSPQIMVNTSAFGTLGSIRGGNLLLFMPMNSSRFWNAEFLPEKIVMKIKCF